MKSLFNNWLWGSQSVFVFMLERREFLRGLRQYFMNHADMQSVAEGIRNGLKEQLVTGLSGSARSVFISSLYEETERPLCIVTHNLFQAQKYMTI